MGKYKINKRFLILCEGVTEYVYAKSLQMDLPRELQRSIAIDIIHETKNDPKSLAIVARAKVKEAKRERNPYEMVWLFFDNDSWPQLSDAFRIIERDGFRVAYTSICFEHWLILHFENIGKPFAKGEDALKRLKSFWPEYHKTKSNPYKELLDRMDLAISRADVLNKNSNVELAVHQRNPYFTVGDLINFFRTLK